MVGTVVDSYRIEAVLGAGGMGVVYRAVDTSLDKIVALKVMNPRLIGDERFLRRFKAEARALGRLQHPHIVNVFAFRQAEPFLLIITEYIEGGTLTGLIKRRGPLPWQTAVPIMRQTLSAIAYAHGQQIIHRDIKPGNILLTQAGAVKVTDFGLAKIQVASAGSLGATSAEFAAGTLCYMPPEQLEGLANVDQRGDVYALGMTFYEMLAGRTPFAQLGSDYAVQKAIDAHDFPSLDQLNEAVPGPLVQVVTKAIEREPEDRYPSADAMLAALETWEDQTVCRATGGVGTAMRVTPGTPERAVPWMRKRKHAATDLLQAITEMQRPAAWRAQRGRKKLYAPRNVGVVGSLVGVLLLVSLLFTQDGRRLVEPLGGAPVFQSGTAAPQRKPQPIVQEAAPSMVAASDDRGETPARGPSTPPVRPMLDEADQPETHGTQPPPVLSEAIPAMIAVASLDEADEAAEGAHDLVKASLQPLVSPVLPDSLTPAVASLQRTEEADTLARGVLRVKPIPWGNVYVDGAPHAYEIDYWYTLSLSAQSHRITVRNPVLDRTWTSDVILTPGDTQEVAIDFMARVDVNVAAKDTAGHPVSGEIYVDGNPTGDWSPIKIEVYPGLHRIEVRAPGYTQFEVREARGEASLPLENPAHFNLNHQARIVHAILKKTLDE